MHEFPHSWARRKLGELGRYVNGMAFKPSDWGAEGLPIIRIQNLTDPAKPFNRYAREVKPRYLVSNGDLLISWSASLGSFIWDRGEAILNQHIFKVEVNKSLVEKEFLHFLVLRILEQMKGHTHGSTMKHITKGKFDALEVGVPSLQEQRRIVGRIKECTSRLDEIRALRTESKREADALLSGARYDAFRAESRIATLDAIIADGPTNGLYKHSKFYGSGTAILRINNFNSGDVCTGGGELKRLQVDASELERFRLRAGDIVLNRVNGSLEVVGKACLIGNLREATVFESNMMRFSVNAAKADPGYVLHFLASPQCRDQLKEKARIIQQASINQKDVASLKLPLPSLSEQRGIARHLDQISVLARQAVGEMSAASTVFEAVPAAVLRKAFAGEL